jgi:hypothetical protein
MYTRAYVFVTALLYTCAPGLQAPIRS